MSHIYFSDNKKTWMIKDLLHTQLSRADYKQRNKDIEKEKKKIQDEINEKQVASGMTHLL